MRLHEEYAARHGIAVPGVSYTGFSLLGQDEQGWIALTSTYRRPLISTGRRPRNITGEFFIQSWRPIHNDNDGRYFSALDEYILDWDEYENWLLTFDHGWKPVESGLPLAQWKVFLYNCDEWLSSQGMSEKLYSTIDIDLPDEIRLMHIEQALSMMPEKQDYWHGLCNFFSNYGHWYARLILIRNAI